MKIQKTSDQSYNISNKGGFKLPIFKIILVSILSIFFISSLVLNIKLLKIFVFLIFAIFMFFIDNIKVSLNIIFKITILVISIILLKLISILFNGQIRTDLFVNKSIDFAFIKTQFTLLVEQILNISNSILFSNIAFKLIEKEKFGRVKKIYSFANQIVRDGRNKLSTIKKFKVKYLSYFFAYIIEDAYNIFYKDEDYNEKMSNVENIK